MNNHYISLAPLKNGASIVMTVRMSFQIRRFEVKVHHVYVPFDNYDSIRQTKFSMWRKYAINNGKGRKWRTYLENICDDNQQT